MPRLALLLPFLFAAIPAHAEERRYMVTSFDRISVEGPYDVEVTNGTSAAAVASGEARALDEVDVHVEGRTLVVGKGINAWGGYPGARRALPRVVVTAVGLRSAMVVGGGRLTVDRLRGLRVDLTLNGSGAIVVGDVAADRLEATLFGTGALTLAGSALRARFQSDGAGMIDAERLQAGALTAIVRSDGDSRFAARDTASVTATGHGSVSVAGAPSCTVSGTARVDCGKLPSR